MVVKENPGRKKYIRQESDDGDSKKFHYIPNLTFTTESFLLKLQALGAGQGSFLGNFVECFRITIFCFLGSDLPVQTNNICNSNTAKIMVVFQNF